MAEAARARRARQKRIFGRLLSEKDALTRRVSAMEKALDDILTSTREQETAMKAEKALAPVPDPKRGAWPFIVPFPDDRSAEEIIASKDARHKVVEDERGQRGSCPDCGSEWYPVGGCLAKCYDKKPWESSKSWGK